MVRDTALLNYAILDKIAVTPMRSSDQLYQKAIEGFLTSLDRLEEARKSPNRPNPDSPKSTEESPESEASLVSQPAQLLDDRESQMLEEAMADIEQMMQQSQKP